jgi:hypothetical protein
MRRNDLLKMIYLKKVDELSNSEKHQIITLANDYVFSNSFDVTKNYLNEYFQNTEYDIVIHINNEVITAFSFYKFSKTTLKKSKKNIPLVQFSLTAKSPKSGKNIISLLSTHYFKQKLGNYYWLKKIIATSVIVNPKVFQVFVKHFPINNFNLCNFNPNEVKQILNNQYVTHENRTIISDNILAIKNINKLQDISQVWEGSYKSSLDSINKLFVDKGIIINDNNSISISNLNLLAFGYRSPFLVKSYLPKRSLKQTDKQLQRLAEIKLSV